jgi:NAD(P)-dependent dehydrogenase (short-subunit alcohol dehydrogenase family)
MASSVIVTGAARGIGRAIGERLAGNGARVTIVDEDPAGRAAAEALPGEGHTFLEGDVADPQTAERAVATALIAGGGLDGLVCNAGIMARRPLAELSLEAWRRVLDVNLTSAFLFAKAAQGYLQAVRGGIVLIASTRAHMSEPNTESYSASKGGLLALGHALAISLGPEVRVNCISPGWIDTSNGPLSADDHAQHPAGRVGKPEDVAALTAWLLGPESGFVTGAEFVVDGGMTRKMIYV